MSRDWTPAEAAAFLGVSVVTLAHWRVQGRGPVYRKLPGGGPHGHGARIGYPQDTTRAWRDSLPLRTSTTQPTA